MWCQPAVAVENISHGNSRHLKVLNVLHFGYCWTSTANKTNRSCTIQKQFNKN